MVFVLLVSSTSVIKAYSSGRMVPSGISDVVIISVHSEKTRLKKLMIMIMMMMMIIIITKLKEMTVFSGHKILTSTMNLRPESDGRL